MHEDDDLNGPSSIPEGQVKVHKNAHGMETPSPNTVDSHPTFSLLSLGVQNTGMENQLGIVITVSSGYLQFVYLESQGKSQMKLPWLQTAHAGVAGVQTSHCGRRGVALLVGSRQQNLGSARLAQKSPKYPNVEHVGFPWLLGPSGELLLVLVALPAQFTARGWVICGCV